MNRWTTHTNLLGCILTILLNDTTGIKTENKIKHRMVTSRSPEIQPLVPSCVADHLAATLSFSSQHIKARSYGHTVIRHVIHVDVNRGDQEGPMDPSWQPFLLSGSNIHRSLWAKFFHHVPVKMGQMASGRWNFLRLADLAEMWAEKNELPHWFPY